MNVTAKALALRVKSDRLWTTTSLYVTLDETSGILQGPVVIERLAEPEEVWMTSTDEVSNAERS